MSTVVKILVTLGLVLPLGAFVAGSLAASGADDPGPRPAIVIPDSPSRSAAPGDDRSPSRGPSDDSSPDDHGGVGVITPSPDDLDDHGDDSGRDGEAGDDHGGSDDSGLRGGDSDNSGSDDSGSDDSGSHSGGSDDSGHGGGHG